MNREDIIRMARQVEAEGFAPVGVWPEVRRLCELAYAAGAAAEREACAKVCDETLAQHYMKQTIPERDEALFLAVCADCAAAIRARSNA